MSKDMTITATNLILILDVSIFNILNYLLLCILKIKHIGVKQVKFSSHEMVFLLDVC